jgi:hypothetical protein
VFKHGSQLICNCCWPPAGLAEARRLGLPISEQETLFSTPPDLQQLEDLLMAHPYPQVLSTTLLLTTSTAVHSLHLGEA